MTDQMLIARPGNKNLPPDKSTVSTEVILQSAVERMKHNLFSQRFVPRKFYPKKTNFEPAINDTRRYIQSITIEEARHIEYQLIHHVSSDEAYSLSIHENGDILIKTVSLKGGLYAIQTLSQLFYAHSRYRDDIYTPYAPVVITDGPAFQHRGLNLDIARNWIPPKAVMKTIDAMSHNKLNRLHIHASDSQSWPLEIPSLPNLALDGAYDGSQTWTTSDLQEVQRFGLERGVEVYLEIDLPGHTTSIAHSYPNLIVAANEHPWHLFALEPPAGQLKLNSSDVYSFLTILLNDLLPRSAPYSSYFHIGGDEVNTRAYSLDPTINSSSIDVLRPLLQSLYTRLISITESHSLTPIVWEEMILDWNLTLPQTTIVQAWRSAESLASILRTGHKALFGSNTHWYLDCGQGTFLDRNSTNPDSPIGPPYTDYCSPYKNWRHVYSYDPLANIPESQRQLIAGGEVHLWGEMTDSVTLDVMLWPRVAAAAEVLWSGTGKPVTEDTTRRLAEMRERLVASGVGAGMVQMEWCLRNKGNCIL
ncbi:MAG: N-acetyl-glucosamine-6-phosphate deacetylase [Cirrosporium novae-zelandiae]|nr:MAG: N-acetyl-glucosamine-6-phosphate deacetylase [Cirrosporium novae-zelandiae]